MREPSGGGWGLEKDTGEEWGTFPDLGGGYTAAIFVIILILHNSRLCTLLYLGCISNKMGKKQAIIPHLCIIREMQITAISKYHNHLSGIWESKCLIIYCINQTVRKIQFFISFLLLSHYIISWFNIHGRQLWYICTMKFYTTIKKECRISLWTDMKKRMYLECHLLC